MSRKHLVVLPSGTRLSVRTPLADDGADIAVGAEVTVHWEIDHGVLVPDDAG